MSLSEETVALFAVAERWNLKKDKLRFLDQWNFLWEPDEEMGGFLTLEGFVVAGNKEEPLAQGASLRYTQTSPVTALDNGVAVTISNSNYVLMHPTSDCINLLTQIGNPLTFERIVEWLKTNKMG